MNKTKQIEVQKADGIEFLRDENQVLYPNGKFYTPKTPYVARRLAAKDLILVPTRKEM